MRLLTGAFILALLPLAGCSEEEPGRAPAAPSDAPLARAWEHDLVLAPNSYPDAVVVSEGHWLSAASFDNSPGTTNPTPNVPLPYAIGDSETGEVTTLDPLGVGPVRAIPGTDLFVAVAGGRVGVIDPAVPEMVWSRRAIGPEVVDLSPTRIWMGRVTDDGQPICLTVDTGRVVRHDAACLAADLDPPNVIDGVSWYENPTLVDVPGGAQVQVQVPTVRAQDVETSEPLWSYGSLAAVTVDDEVSLDYSAFTGSDLGLVRVDYRDGWATLHLLDIRTGEVTRTLGRVDAGRLVGFAGDVAVFEERDADSPPTVMGYRVGP